MTPRRASSKSSQVHYFSDNRFEDLVFRLSAVLTGTVPVTVNWQADTPERVVYKVSVTQSKLVLMDGAPGVTFKRPLAAAAAATATSAVDRRRRVPRGELTKGRVSLQQARVERLEVEAHLRRMRARAEARHVLLATWHASEEVQHAGPKPLRSAEGRGHGQCCQHGRAREGCRR